MSTFDETDGRYYTKGLTYNKTETNTLLAAVPSGDQGPVPSTSFNPGPTVAGKSYSADPGTYANFLDNGGNPCVIPAPVAGHAIILGRLYYNGSFWIPTWKDVTLPSSPGKIQAWAAAAFLTGDQVNYLGRDWVANAATLSTDIPGTSVKWDDRLFSTTNRVNAVETALAPISVPLIVTNQYGNNPSVSAGSPFTAGAATLGKALTACKLSKLVCYFRTAGTFNLLICTLNSGVNFTIVQTIPLTAVLGENTFLPAQFGTINLLPNQWIAIGLTTAAINSAAATGVQNYFSSVTPSTTQNWTSTTANKYGGYFETTENGANVISVDTPNLSPAVQAQLAKTAAIDANTAAAAANTLGIAALNPAIETISKYGYATAVGSGPTSTGTAFGGSGAFTLGAPVPVVSVLNKIVVRFGTAGTFTLVVMNKATANNVMTHVQSVALNGVVGENTFLPTDFGLVNLLAGQYIGIVLGTATSYYKATTGVNYYYSSGTPTSGTTNWSNTTTNIYGGNAYYEYATPKQLIDEGHIDPAFTAKVNNPQLVLNPRRPALVYDAGFNSTVAPTDWLVSSGWTWTASGLLSPAGASNWTQIAQQNNPGGPSNEESIRRFRFVPQATGIKFAAGTYCTGAYGGTANKSTLFSISDAENLIKFYSIGTNSWPTEPAVYATAPLLPLVAGKHYLIEMKRYRRTNTVTVYDIATNQVMGTLTNDYILPTDNLFTGSQVGSFIIFNQIGQTAFTRVSLSHACFNPRLYEMGDSISEGLTVALPDRWLQMVFNDLKGSVALNGISGSQMREIAQKLMYDIPAMKPQWIICYFNHNDGDGAGSNVTTAYNQLMTYCQTNGINLAVCCLAPQPASNYAVFNAYVLSLPGWVRKIRMDLALTTNHDGVTYNAAIYNDNHHPNAAGNLLEYARVKMDVPELFY